MIEIKQSVRSDLEEFFGEKEFPLSVRSWSVFKDEVLVSVFGYTIRDDGCIVFCDIKEGYGKIEVARTARKAFKLLTKNKKRLLAIQDQRLCTSERFLNFMGFKRIGNSSAFEYIGEA